MWKNTCLNLLIIYPIFSQVTGTSLVDNFGKTSDLHVRKRRVIDRSPMANTIVSIHHVPYIVNILENGFPSCGGSILHAHIIVTAAHCVENPAIYRVLSGSSYINQGINHNVRKKILHPEYHSRALPNDLALLIIFPPIDLNYNSVNKKIPLYNGYIQPLELVTVSGWGCMQEIGGRCVYSRELRSIKVPVLHQNTCAHIFQNHTQITDKEICSFESHGLRYCGPGDSGGPLIFNGKLAGVLTFTGGANKPDVFVNLSHAEYRRWILITITRHTLNYK